MPPRRHQVDQPFAPDVGIQAFHEVGALGRDAPVAFAALAGAAEVTAEREQGGGRDIAGVGAERDGFHHVRCAPDRAADDERHVVADPLVAQPLIHRGERQFDRDADVVADPGRRGAGPAPEPVDRDDVRAAAGDPAGDGGDIVDGGDLDDHRLPVPRRLFERKDQLPEVLDRIDVVMRGGGDRVGTLRDHPGTRDVADDLRAGQMPADAGFRALSHFDLDRRAGVEIILVHAEAPRRDLYDGILSVNVEVLVKSALSRVVEDSQFGRGAGERGVGVITDRTVTHRREHHRHRKFDLRRERAVDLPVRRPRHLFGLLAEEDARLHRLAERVDRGVGHLRRVDQDLVPIDRKRLRVSHRGEQDAPAGRLFVDLPDRVVLPVRVLAERAVAFDDFQRPRRAERDASLTVDALGLVAYHHAALGAESMYLVRALALADAAGDAAVGVADHFKLGINELDAHISTLLP